MFNNKLKPADQLKFLKRLRFLVAIDGMVLSKAMIIIAESGAGTISDEADYIETSLADNSSVYDAFEHFDDRVRTIISVAFQSKKMKEGVATSIDIMRKESVSGKGLYQAMVMPLFVILVQLLLIGYMAKEVIPSLSDIAPRDMWPMTTIITYAIGNFVYTYGIPTIIAIAILFWFIQRCKPNLIGDRRDFAEKYFGWCGFGFYKSMVAYQFLSTLNYLMAGKDMVFATALVSIKEYSTPYLRWHIEKMLSRLGSANDAQNISEAINTGLLTNEDVSSFYIAGEGKTIDEAIKSVADDREENIVDDIFKSRLRVELLLSIISAILGALVVLSVAPMLINVDITGKR